MLKHLSALAACSCFTAALIGCESMSGGADASDHAGSHALAGSEHDLDGFTTEVRGEYLYVTAEGEELPEKPVTLVGHGPDGMSVRGSSDTINAYLDAR
jgi:hypothetical protein